MADSVLIDPYGTPLAPASPGVASASVLRQALPTGLFDAEDVGYQRLTGAARRDLAPLRQDRMIEIAAYLYRENPLAKWMLEITRDFLLAEGLRVQAEEDDVQEVLDAHWKDPLNLWDLKAGNKFLELGLYGEQLWPVAVNASSGLVRLANVDPSRIRAVEHDPDNAEAPIGVVLRGRAGHPGRKLKVIYPRPDDELFASPAARRRAEYFTDGEAFWWATNKVATATRGVSDLLALADWLDGYEQFLFNTSDRVGYLNAFVWDVVLRGMDAAQIRQWLAENPAPKPGSQFAHNENVELTPKTPSLQGADLSEMARVFRNHILGGYGLPSFWHGGSDDANLACYSADTETLTMEGFKFYWEITEDTRIAAYDPARHELVFVPAGPIYLYDYDGDMVEIKTRNTDICVTPNHRMYAKPCYSLAKKHLETYRFITAEALEARRGQEAKWKILPTAPWPGEELESVHIPAVRAELGSRAIYPALDIPADVFLEFLGYWLTEGHTRTRKSVKRGFAIGLAQKHPQNVEKIRKCLARLSAFTWHEVQEPGGIVRWTTADKGLYFWLREHCGEGSYSKRLPLWARRVSTRQARILFDALMLGDGHWITPPTATTGTGLFYSVSKALVDDMQWLAMRLGYRSSLWFDTRPGKSPTYQLMFSSVRESALRQRQVQRVPYRGKVYCYSVPTGLFVTRRNGKIAIQGNTATALGTPTFKRFQYRQRLTRYMVTYVLDYQLQQAQRTGGLRATNLSYTLLMPQLQAEDVSRVATALMQLTSAVMMAEDRAWIDAGTAQRLFAALAARFGVEVPLDAEGANADARVTPDYRTRTAARVAGGRG